MRERGGEGEEEEAAAAAASSVAPASREKETSLFLLLWQHEKRDERVCPPSLGVGAPRRPLLQRGGKTGSVE